VTLDPQPERLLRTGDILDRVPISMDEFLDLLNEQKVIPTTVAPIERRGRGFLYLPASADDLPRLRFTADTVEHIRSLRQPE